MNAIHCTAAPATKQEIRHKSTTHEERYAHFTEHNCNINFGHRFCGATVFARKEEKRNTWFMAIAFCSRKDKFCRKVGRQVARRRYFLYKQQQSIVSSTFIFVLGPEFNYDALTKTVAGVVASCLVSKQSMP